jgi:hypothetical protein
VNGSVFSQASKALRYSGVKRRTSAAWSCGLLSARAWSQAVNMEASAASRWPPRVEAASAWKRSLLDSAYRTDWWPSPLAAW